MLKLQACHVSGLDKKGYHTAGVTNSEIAGSFVDPLEHNLSAVLMQYLLFGSSKTLLISETAFELGELFHQPGCYAKGEEDGRRRAPLFMVTVSRWNTGRVLQA